MSEEYKPTTLKLVIFLSLFVASTFLICGGGSVVMFAVWDFLVSIYDQYSKWRAQQADWVKFGIGSAVVAAIFSLLVLLGHIVGPPEEKKIKEKESDKESEQS